MSSIGVKVLLRNATIISEMDKILSFQQIHEFISGELTE